MSNPSPKPNMVKQKHKAKKTAIIYEEKGDEYEQLVSDLKNFILRIDKVTTNIGVLKSGIKKLTSSKQRLNHSSSSSAA